MLNLFLHRDTSTDQSMEGQLFDGQNFECYTLERPWKDNKPEISCIPAKVYAITMTFSGHFQRMMPLLVNVKDRSEIRIHPANWPKQLLGCIAVGDSRGKDAIGLSVKAFDILYAKIEKCFKAKEEMQITITDPPGVDTTLGATA